MDKLEALEIIWKMLPVDATDLQKEAWQTVKCIVHMPQADNSKSDAIALLISIGSILDANLDILSGSQWHKRVNAVTISPAE